MRGKVGDDYYIKRTINGGIERHALIIIIFSENEDHAIINN